MLKHPLFLFYGPGCETKFQLNQANVCVRQRSFFDIIPEAYLIKQEILYYSSEIWEEHRL
jgi:hypothetical protein